MFIKSACGCSLCAFCHAILIYAYSVSALNFSIEMSFDQRIYTLCRSVWEYSAGQRICQRWRRLGRRRQNFLFCHW